MQNDPKDLSTMQPPVAPSADIVSMTTAEYESLRTQTFNPSNWPIAPVGAIVSPTDSSQLQNSIRNTRSETPSSFKLAKTNQVRDIILFVSGLIVILGFIVPIGRILILPIILVLVIAVFYDSYKTRTHPRQDVPVPQPVVLNGVTYAPLVAKVPKTATSSVISIVSKVVGAVAILFVAIIALFLLFISSVVSSTGGRGS